MMETSVVLATIQHIKQLRGATAGMVMSDKTMIAHIQLPVRQMEGGHPQMMDVRDIAQVRLTQTKSYDQL